GGDFLRLDFGARQFRKFAWRIADNQRGAPSRHHDALAELSRLELAHYAGSDGEWLFHGLLIGNVASPPLPHQFPRVTSRSVVQHKHHVALVAGLLFDVIGY